MSYKFTKGSQVIGDLKAADDAERNTLIDFGEDQIEFQTSGSTRLKVDNNGVTVQNGNLSFEDVMVIELSIPGLDLQTDPTAFVFNCPYDLDILGLDLHLQTAGSSLTRVELTGSGTGITSVSLNASVLSGSSPAINSPTGSLGKDDSVIFNITNAGTNAQGLRANMFFQRVITNEGP